MKEQMSSFDIAAVVRECRSVVDFRMEKVFLPTHREFFFRLTSRDEKKSVMIKIGQAMWMEDGFRQADSTQPHTFAMLLRKHLSGLRLKSVGQYGFDRVVVFEWDSEPAMRLVVELFGSGNIILVQGDTIIKPLTSRTWRARDVKAGREFLFPPDSVNPLELGMDELSGILKGSARDMVRCLALDVNLGGAHAEEVCSVVGKEKSLPAKELTDQDIRAIHGIIQEFGKRLERPEPVIILKDHVPVNVQPFALSIHSENEKKNFGSISEAVREYFSNVQVQVREEVTATESRKARLERQIEQQRTAVKEMKADARNFQEAGDRLYANYRKANDVLERVKVLLEDGNWQAAKKEIESMDDVERFDASEGWFILRLDDAISVKMDVRLDLNDNAALLYERAKKAKHKMEGAMEALADTGKDIEAVISAAEDDEAKHRAKKKPTKRFWFERFRWFVSSGGNIVLGGRDARTNDQVVKKHLKPADLYAHADIHGASSVVIKDGNAASEETLTEACMFALCFSKAWRGKMASGSAYWVKPDQVSKTPQPGEFLARGAFVIRGKRNHSKKLDIRLAVGKVLIEGEEKVMCGPERAVASLTREYFVIQPGDKARQGFAKELSDLYNVPIEEIDRILPAGDVKIINRPN